MEVPEKRKKNGAFRSCLIPYKEQIFTWWFDEKMTSREIQSLLMEKFQIDVSHSTITRFIKVRITKPDPHERPVPLPSPEIKPLRKAKPVAERPEIPETPLTLDELESDKEHSADWFLRKLATTTRRDFGRISAEKKKKEE